MLTYPKGSIGDFVTFNHFPYKDRKDAQPPSSDGGIRLYMPNSTPQVTNSQGWGELSLPGPAGQLMLGAMNAAGQAIASASHLLPMPMHVSGLGAVCTGTYVPPRRTRAHARPGAR